MGSGLTQGRTVAVGRELMDVAVGASAADIEVDVPVLMVGGAPM